MEKVNFDDYAKQMGVKKKTVKHWVDKGFLLATYSDKKESRIKDIIVEGKNIVKSKENSKNNETNNASVSLKEVDIQQVFNQIEAANYRVGYLEGVIGHLEPQMKLLTDSQSTIETQNRDLELENVQLKTQINFLHERLNKFEESNIHSFLSKL